MRKRTSRGTRTTRPRSQNAAGSWAMAGEFQAGGRSAPGVYGHHLRATGITAGRNIDPGLLRGWRALEEEREVTPQEPDAAAGGSIDSAVDGVMVDDLCPEGVVEALGSSTDSAGSYLRGPGVTPIKITKGRSILSEY